MTVAELIERLAAFGDPNAKILLDVSSDETETQFLCDIQNVTHEQDHGEAETMFVRITGDADVTS